MRTFRRMTKRSDARALVDRALATYEPRSISPGQWATIRPDVEELLAAAAPSSHADVRALVASLLVFLDDCCPKQDLTLEFLTHSKVEEFIRRRRNTGSPESTLQQMRPRLRRLVRTHNHQVPRQNRKAARARVKAFDPLSDEKVQRINALTLPAEQRRAVECAFALADRLGLPRQVVGQARLHGCDLWVGDRLVVQLDPGDPLVTGAVDGEPLLNQHTWATARRTIAKRTGISLHLYRLRHRFLARIRDQQGLSVAQIMLEHGVGRDDLDVLISVAATGDPYISNAQCVQYLTQPVGN